MQAEYVATQNQQYEQGRRDEIPAPHALRLLEQSIQPLDACAAHPLRRTRVSASIKIEYCAYAANDRRMQAALIGLYPFFLLRRRHAHARGGGPGGGGRRRRRRGRGGGPRSGW